MIITFLILFFSLHQDSIGSLGVQAVSAGSFINDSLSSHHPRIRGQTIEEVILSLNEISFVLVRTIIWIIYVHVVHWGSKNRMK